MTEPELPTEAWKIAKVVGTEEEAALVAGFLEANGFAARIESLHASEFPATVGELGEIRIEVPEDQLAEVQSLLADQEIAAETETA